MTKHSANASAPLPQSEAVSAVITGVYAAALFATPLLGAADISGPRFWVLAWLNLLALPFIWVTHKNSPLEIKNRALFLTYLLFVGLNVVSLMFSNNTITSIYTVSKCFTIFNTAIVLYFILQKNKRGLLIFSLVSMGVLLTDFLVVVVGVIQFINDKIDSIYFIKGNYGNKNILAASIFMKYPFSLYLINSDNRKYKMAGAGGLVLGSLALFFLSARTFYIGILAICILYIIYLIKKDNRKVPYKKIFIVITSLVLLLGTYSLVQYVGFRNKQYNNGGKEFSDNFFERIKSISSSEDNRRLFIWRTSLRMFQSHPLEGIGPGNWHTESLQYVNPLVEDYWYPVNAHNDFLEYTTESGIFAGLAYLAIFALIFFRIREIEKDDFAFISVFGIFCFFIDSFFNFPKERPEISLYFSFFVAAALLTTSPFGLKPLTVGKSYQKGMYAVWILLAVGSVYVFNLNFRSLRLQYTIYNDYNKTRKYIRETKYAYSAAYYEDNMPALPTIDVTGKPVAVMLSNIYFKEKNYRKVIELLSESEESPYDGRKEYYLAKVYYETKRYDSAQKYVDKALMLKPYHFPSIEIAGSLLQIRGDLPSALELHKKYTRKYKTNILAWSNIYKMYHNMNARDSALTVIDTALKYYALLPEVEKPKAIAAEMQVYKEGTILDPAYLNAVKEIQNNHLDNAVALLSAYLQRVPGSVAAIQHRADSYFLLGKWSESIQDYQSLIDRGIKNAQYYNNIGVNYKALGNYDKACEYYLIAKQMGNADGARNVLKSCQQAAVK